MAKSNDSKTTIRTTLSKLLAGVDKHFNGQTLIINGVRVKAEDLDARWQAYLAAVTDADTARAQWLGKVDVVNNLAPGIRSDIVGVHDFVRVQVGPSSPTLDDFGMTPWRAATAQRTVAEKAQSIAKSLAARVVRHTLGSKQKAALHGSAPSAPATPTAAKPGNQ